MTLFNPLMEDIQPVLKDPTPMMLPLTREPVKGEKGKNEGSGPQLLPKNFLAALLMAATNLQDAVNGAIMVTAATTMEVMKSAEAALKIGQARLDWFITQIDAAKGDDLSKLVQEYQNASQKIGNVQNANNTNAQEEQTNTANLAQNQKQAIDFATSTKEINAETSQLLSSRI